MSLHRGLAWGTAATPLALIAVEWGSPYPRLGAR